MWYYKTINKFKWNNIFKKVKSIFTNLKLLILINILYNLFIRIIQSYENLLQIATNFPKVNIIDNDVLNNLQQMRVKFYF